VTGERPLAAFFWLWELRFVMALPVELARRARGREWGAKLAAAQELG